MSDLLIIGRRKGDMPLLTKRAVIIHDVAQIAGGVALEEIVPNARGEAIGVVLVKKGWSKQYFLRQRLDWTEDNYFERAEFLMEKKGIVTP